MKCPVCTCAEHRVLDTCDRADSIRRRRKCDRCGHRWTTFERAESRELDREALLANVRSLEALLTGG